jgi:CRISPR-associated protein Csx10
MTAALSLSLLEDVVVSLSSATIGAHKSLDYVPGACLLGAAARLMYRELDEETRWNLFHSAAVQFGNAIPVAPSGKRCLPMPLCFHRFKGSQEETIQNLAAADRKPNRQYQRCKEKWLAPTEQGGWSVFSVKKTGAMRTALSDGQARDGFLYQTEALASGGQFHAHLTCRKGHEQLLDKLIATLTQAKNVQIGRSATAEHGTTAVELGRWEPTPTAATGSGAVVRILCVSDLSLTDPSTGMTRLTPNSSDFGLPASWLWEPSRSFLRSRRYTPFNAYRRRCALDREVLTSGSVICFSREGKDSAVGSAVEVCDGRVGEYTEDGLGEVLFNPAILAQDEVMFSNADNREEVGRSPSMSQGMSELQRWAVVRADNASRRDAIQKLKDDWIHDLKCFPEAERLRSQWGEVRQLGQAARNGGLSSDQLRERLRRLVGTGVRQLAHAWGMQGPDRKSLGEKLLALVAQQPAEMPSVTGAALELLATELPKGQRENRR